MRRICALGFFDGVHLGHAAIIRKTIEIAKNENAIPTVVTFDVRPKNFLGKNSVPLISDSNTKKIIINTLFPGIDIIELGFSDEMSRMSPKDFIQEILLIRLNAAGIVVGEDFRFGKNAEGTPKELSKHIETITVETVVLSGEVVSSSIIRKLMIEGEMGKAVQFLGHPHLISGQVKHGDARGKKLGFATINLDIACSVIKPKSGVYASRVFAEESFYNAVSSLGTRPTFYDNGEFVFETHILNLNENLYGKSINVWMYEYLRPQLKFCSAEELILAMEKDVQNALEVLSKQRNKLKYENHCNNSLQNSR